MELNPFQDSVKEFILSCGQDPDSPNLKNTLQRFYKGIL